MIDVQMPVVVSMVSEFPGSVGVNPLTASRPAVDCWAGLLPSPDAGNCLVAEVREAIAAGELGYHYCRWCYGVVVSGWFAVPVVGLTGVICSGFVGDSVDADPLNS